jgi:hypothetical protein
MQGQCGEFTKITGNRKSAVCTNVIWRGSKLVEVVVAVVLVEVVEVVGLHEKLIQPI